MRNIGNCSNRAPGFCMPKYQLRLPPSVHFERTTFPRFLFLAHEYTRYTVLTLPFKLFDAIHAVENGLIYTLDRVDPTEP